MEINSKGIIPADIEKYLAKWTKYFKGKYGQDFFIKPEGVIDNLAVGVTANSLDFESIMLKLVKEMNPYTAEDEWQDHLYALIGLEREQSSFTVVQRTVQGTPNTTVEAGAVLFENELTKDQFKLIDDCQLNESGVGIGSFRAEEMGAIELPENAKCKIVSAPAAVKAVYFTTGNSIDIGKEYESNAEFRESWLQEQATAKANTEGGLKKILLPYCYGKSNNIKIRMNRNLQKYEDIPLHTANIVVNSPYDDETIAKVIFNKMVDGGFGLVGDIQQVVTDSEGVEEDVYFSRAKLVTVYWQVVVALKEEYELEQVITSVQNAIKNNFSFSMGDAVIANRAIQFIDEIEAIDYVKDVKVSTDNATWMSVLELGETDLAQIGDVDVSV